MFLFYFMLIEFYIDIQTIFGQRIPSWNTTWPNMAINKSAGLPVISEAHYTIYNSTLKDGKPNPNGTYNHGPIIIYHKDHFYMSWYNSPQNESQYMRVLYSKSKDTTDWSSPNELFTNITTKGEENEPWTIINNNLYASCSISKEYPALMRQLYNNNTFSEIFWLSNEIPSNFTHLGYKTYLSMDNQTQNDMQIYLRSLYNDTVMNADNGASFNEKSMYLIPNNGNKQQQQLMLLLRTSSHYQRLFSSTCFINNSNTLNITNIIECRPGIGALNYNLVQIYYNEKANKISNCNWSKPVITNIPDAPSRTCVSQLNDGRIYMVGNQLDKNDDNNENQPRDVLVLSISNSGFDFSKAYTVRYNPPPIKYYGLHKDPGFEYPAAYYDNEYLYISYSVNKEDIQVSLVRLADIK
eukprot:167781_1